MPSARNSKVPRSCFTTCAAFASRARLCRPARTHTYGISLGVLRRLPRLPQGLSLSLRAWQKARFVAHAERFATFLPVPTDANR